MRVVTYENTPLRPLELACWDDLFDHLEAKGMSLAEAAQTVVEARHLPDAGFNYLLGRLHGVIDSAIRSGFAPPDDTQPDLKVLE